MRGSASLEAVVSALVPTLEPYQRSEFRYWFLFRDLIRSRDRTPSVGYGVDWLRNVRELPDKFLLHHESLDAYLYLRFLRTIIFICVVGCGLTWPILMPVNATGGGSSTELERITISNVTKTNHLYAHAVMAWVFLGFVVFTITRERLWLINLRQAWALSMPNAKRLSSRTALFLSVPDDALEENNTKQFFGDGAVRIWPVTKLDTLQELQALILERDDLIEKLESAETVLIHKASSLSAHRGADGRTRYMLSYSDIPDLVKMGMRLLSQPKKLLFGSYVGLAQGEEVDTIQSLRDLIKQKEELICETRRRYYNGESDGTAAVFVEFKTQAEAQRACEQVASLDALTLTPRYAGVKPKEIIWNNLNISPIKRISQHGVALATVASTIILWSVPSGLVGLVSNINYLAENFESLSFLSDLPGPLDGLLTGLIPPLLTSYLSKDVHLLFRITAVFSGAATLASQLAKNLRDPTAIPALLATQLPKSSNYYLTYFIVQGITSAADNLLNYSELLNYLSLEYLVDETPRQKFSRHTSMKDIAWGQVFPKVLTSSGNQRLLTYHLAIVYSCIAPLVLGFAAAGLSLYYLSYRYNLFYVIQPKIDTQGQAYTLALRHLLVGVYIAQLALMGFFGLHKANGPSVIIGVLFIFTILYSVLMNKYISPFEEQFPFDSASLKGRQEESIPLLSSIEEGQGTFTSSSAAEHGAESTASEHLGFMPYNFMKPWVREEKVLDHEDFDVPDYTEEELTRAYLHPALTSPAPVIWMPRDPAGASEAEVRETEEFGLRASDEGAWLDESRMVRWDMDNIEDVPVWKKAVTY
ncbi:hypothetical protein RRF57_001694 [Xylaria bambusicola]|uniref:DUF221-domain-containing protein n=1 Tax=Xylaria bambusicola TaxID=326684 RepID=A0AAN7UCD7_9PEZI